MTQQSFKYVGLGAEGKRTSGTIHAENESQACSLLIDQQITPVRVTPAKQSAMMSFGSGRGTISTNDIAALTREMSVLVEANIPIARGLRSIAEHEKNRALRDMVSDIADQIEAGEKLTTAFGKHAAVFGDVYIETIRAAEQTGTLSGVARHLADMLERNVETRSQLRRAMTYPLIVISFVILALVVIVVFVVPKFATIFETNGVPLPLATRIITAIGTVVKDYWWAIILAVGSGFFAFVSAWKSPTGRYRIELAALRLPYISNLLTATTAARFSRVLSIGLESGIEVIESMTIAANATGRPVFARECQGLCDRMLAGESLESVMSDARRLPSFARRLISAGKDATELASASRIIARHYDRICDHLAKNINTIIEPMITIAIAGIVLLVALSVFLPMWKMVSLQH